MSVVTLLALFGGGLLWAAGSGGSPARAARVAAQGTTPAPLATLRIIDPAAEVRREGAAAFRPGRTGQALRQGDTIRTDATGLAELAYTDGSLTRLGPTTEFTIAELTAERGGRQTSGSLSIGQTWSRAAKVAETGHFEVKAGGTTAAVEGTAFAFSCTGPADAQVCEIIDIVDNVRVTNETGQMVSLVPASSVTSTDGELGSLTKLTRQQLLANDFIVDNLLLDQAAGKGAGLDDLPPPATGTTVASAGPVVDTIEVPTPTVVVQETAPSLSVEAPLPPGPPPPPPPPSAPECVNGAWTALVGAGGQTFATEQACSDFVLVGGQLAQTGGGVFVVPRGATVTLAGVSPSAFNALQFGYQLNFDGSTTNLVGDPKPEGDLDVPLGGIAFVPSTDNAVLLRVFLQDDSCGVVFFSDGNHASLDPANASDVWIQDAGGDCEFPPDDPVGRPPDPTDLNLIVTVTIG